MPCGFIRQLSKLRKSSSEAVENTKSFAHSKEYLHIERSVEEELRILLRKLNISQKKCLVLLCGSAGDGKSHLMSYLKHSDPENLLEGYELYNDATESSKPELKAIDTLAEKLSPFNDENYSSDDGYKLVVAINLGMLNNFIDSEKGRKYTELKKYIDAMGILTIAQNKATNSNHGVFYHVNFSDYQVFSLISDGLKTTYLQQLINKIFQITDDNPFCQAHQSCASCTIGKCCPVHHNYVFLSNPVYQRHLIRRIVEVVIKDKAIVSIREVLNLVYDLIVHPDFNQTQFCSLSSSQVGFLEQYLLFSTPMLLNSSDDTSPLLDKILCHDPLKTRNEDIDVAATKFHSVENIKETFSIAANATPYFVLTEITNISELGAIKPELKKLVYQFIIRLQSFREGTYQMDLQLFNEYISYLYHYYHGNVRGLRDLYKAVQKAIFSWNGEFGNGLICIDDSNEFFWILERLDIKPAKMRDQGIDDDEIQRFAPSIKLYFTSVPETENGIAEIDVDYSLFEIISAMKEGYRPTWKDKNLHTDFISFLQKIISFGEKHKSVTIVPKNDHNATKYRFIDDELGAVFEEVRV